MTIKKDQATGEFFKLSLLRHSAAHVLAAAVLELYPEAKFGIGPSTEEGFYYDFDLATPLGPADLEKIAEKMRVLIKKNLKFELQELALEGAINLFKKKNQTYKVELLRDLQGQGEQTVTLYRTGDFLDLCKGPHLKTTGKLNPRAIKLLKVAGAYWRGDEKNPMLQRIYGTAFNKPESLNKYLAQMEEAKKRDHRKIGKALDLFSFHEEAPGMTFWHAKGWAIFSQILEYWRAVHRRHGYLEVNTPIILSKKLWLQSGHWDHYKENMYFTKVDDREFAVKPMNCPGNLLIYQEKMHSYRDLPLLIGEIGTVHRHEKAGVLAGLFRVREITQDDAHIFCTEKQMVKEVSKVYDLITQLYAAFGFQDYHVELSTRPPKSIGTDEMWRLAEATLSQVLEEKRKDYKVNPGEGAFYGPKIDFHIKDALGRSWQCGTIQLDLAMPEAFNVFYIDQQGKKKRPVMIHRTALGSIERFIGILIEHYAGALPLWLSPIQVIILPVAEEKHKGYAQEVEHALAKQQIRVQLDQENASINKRVHAAEVQKIPYILVVGDEEEKDKLVAVRTRGSQKIAKILVKDFISQILEEIKLKK